MKLQRKQYETTQEKRSDFGLGVLVFFLVNGLLLVLVISTSELLSNESIPSSTSTTLRIGINCLVFLINIGLLIFFSLTRSWVALGMLSTIAILLAIPLALGIVFSIACLILNGLNLFQ